MDAMRGGWISACPTLLFLEVLVRLNCRLSSVRGKGKAKRLGTSMINN